MLALVWVSVSLAVTTIGVKRRLKRIHSLGGQLGVTSPPNVALSRLVSPYVVLCRLMSPYVALIFPHVDINGEILVT